ncbi:hypothetical protein [Paenibacillus ferrarius]|uniref:hypothetical protein n=1 Tax=Paenibacillus ferrarius TaxID=1469647 RepID=UPI003D2935B4
MKQRAKFIKRILVVPIIVILIFSLAIPALADSNLITNGLNKVDMVLHPEEHARQDEQKEEKPQTLTQEVSVPPQIDTQISSIKEKAKENRKNRLHQSDEYNYTQKDVESLLLNGSTLEDIYRSDEIGNQLLVNPLELIKAKREGRQSWDDIEKDMIMQKQKQLKALLKKHPAMESTFSKQTVSDAEKVEILQHLDTSDDATDEVLAAFKSEGRSGLEKLQHKKSNTKGGK